MARALFISETFVKENSEVDENVDMKLVNPTIWLCQKKYIEKTLGTILYNDLAAKIIAGTLAGDDLTLVNDYVADALLYWVRNELLIPMTYKFKNKSVGKNSDTNQQPVSFEEHKYVRDYYKPNAQYFTERLELYLCANESLYPLYCTENEVDELSPQDTPPVTAMFLGRTKPTYDAYGNCINE